MAIPSLHACRAYVIMIILSTATLANCSKHFLFKSALKIFTDIVIFTRFRKIIIRTDIREGLNKQIKVAYEILMNNEH